MSRSQGSRLCCSPPCFQFALIVHFSLRKAGCRLGFGRRVNAAIYRPVLRTKVGSQSSEHGVITTVKTVKRLLPSLACHGRFGGKAV